MLLIETLVKTYDKKIKKYCNSDNREQERAKPRAITSNAIFKPIQDAINNETNEKNDRNISNQDTSNSNSNSR